MKKKCEYSAMNFCKNKTIFKISNNYITGGIVNL